MYTLSLSRAPQTSCTDRNETSIFHIASSKLLLVRFPVIHTICIGIWMHVAHIVNVQGELNIVQSQWRHEGGMGDIAHQKHPPPHQNQIWYLITHLQQILRFLPPSAMHFSPSMPYKTLLVLPLYNPNLKTISYSWYTPYTCATPKIELLRNSYDEELSFCGSHKHLLLMRRPWSLNSPMCTNTMIL